MRTSDPDCDVYVFYNGKHYETQVRYKETNPEYKPEPIGANNSAEFITAEMDKRFRDFDNSHRGEHFLHQTAQGCLDNLLRLQKDEVKLSLSGITQLKGVAERERKA